MLKKDNLAFGLLIGAILPCFLFGLLSIIALWVEPGTSLALLFEQNRMLLLSIFINLLPVRLYFVNWKLDKTGRGVLMMTFILMVSYFIFIRYF